MSHVSHIVVFYNKDGVRESRTVLNKSNVWEAIIQVLMEYDRPLRSIADVYALGPNIDTTPEDFK